MRGDSTVNIAAPDDGSPNADALAVQAPSIWDGAAWADPSPLNASNKAQVTRLRPQRLNKSIAKT